jgi:hypothetical protein
MSEAREDTQSITTTDLAVAGRQRPPIEGAALPDAQEHEELSDSQPPVSLFAGDEAQRFRTEWNDIQITFVDEPRGAVEKADGLVARVIQQLAQMFADERARLEGEWSRGGDVSTEDLRLALRRYRSFFDRLLSV